MSDRSCESTNIHVVGRGDVAVAMSSGQAKRGKERDRDVSAKARVGDTQGKNRL